MANTIPYIGSKISLISNSEIRYEGILYTINTQESTIALQSVKTFGTEGRKMPEIPPSSEVYDFIIFRGQDIKDLTVLEGAQGSSSPMLSDPAIMSMNQRPSGGAPGKGGGKADYSKGAGKQEKGYSSGGWNQPSKGGDNGKGWGKDAKDAWGQSSKGGDKGKGWGKDSRDDWGQSSKGGGWGKGGGGGNAWDNGKGRSAASAWDSGKGHSRDGGKGKDYYGYGKGGGGYKGGKGDGWGKGKGKDDGKGKGKGNRDGYGKGSGKGDRGNRYKGSSFNATGVPVGELLPEANSATKQQCAEDFDVDAANTKFEKVTDEGDKPKPLSGYSKTSSFFDNISCEATDRAAESERPKVDREKARQYDRDTFGDTRRPPRPVGVRRTKGKGGGK